MPTDFNDTPVFDGSNQSPSSALDSIPLGTAEQERQRAKNWFDTGAMHARNEEYWRERAKAAEAKGEPQPSDVGVFHRDYEADIQKLLHRIRALEIAARFSEHSGDVRIPSPPGVFTISPEMLATAAQVLSSFLGAKAGSSRGAHRFEEEADYIHERLDKVDEALQALSKTLQEMAPKPSA